jgi:hypothetical protein
LWEVRRFEVTEEDAKLERLRAAISGSGRGVPAGHYTGLYRGGAVIMSDTPDEIREHYEAIEKAKGQCLVAGLGLGVVVQAILNKAEVELVTVVEIAPEVIALVGPHLSPQSKLHIIQDNCLTWQPPKSDKWDMAWYDIWDELCSDNLPVMAKLKRRFARRVVWQGCWGEDYIRAHKRRYGW